MTQLIERNIEEEVKVRLRRRASRHGHSVEEEVRDILRDAVKKEEQRSAGMGTEMNRLFKGIGLKKDIPELKGVRTKEALFET